MRSTTAAVAAAALLAGTTLALNPSCAPGGNFDLSKFQLQLPYYDSNGNVATENSNALEGCNGFQKSGVFFTESGDGALVMKAPGAPDQTGCAKTSGSKHCRTEFRENGSWKPTASKNQLFVELVVPNENESSSTVIGQVFQANTEHSKPIAELYYSHAGEINFRVAKAQEGNGGQAPNVVGHVSPGTKFTYEIHYQNNDLSISINGGSFTKVDTYFDSPGAYFKAGAYNQDTENHTSDVHLLQLVVRH